MQPKTHTTVIPGVSQPVSLDLPADIGALRQSAADAQHGEPGEWVEAIVVDCRSWSAHDEGEDWLVWRGRMAAQRLKHLPIALEAGERIVGRPLLRQPGEADRPTIEKARARLASMPWFPGGDRGHLHPDYEMLFRLGIGGVLEEIDGRRRGAESSRRAFYDACRLAMEGMASYVRRVGRGCAEMARKEPEGAARWRELARICRKVAVKPPATFHEAIQLMFLVQVALTYGEDHYLTSPGRMDRTLRPFYEADLAAGRISPQEALELIACLYIQQNRIVRPGLAVAVMVGGRDRDGRDATNDLTYLCLAARLATRLAYPTVGLAWHEDTPDELMDFAVSMLGTGVGDPAFFNDALIARGLRDRGVSEEDSRNWANSTCVEIKVVGASNIWVTQPYINLTTPLLEVIREGAADGDPGSFGEFVARIEAKLGASIGRAAQELGKVWRARAERACFPLASCLTRDCLQRGLDLDRGGARYNWVENSFVGLANLVDGLVTVKQLVYGKRQLTLGQLAQILDADFAGHEALRQQILYRLPKYGNDEDEPDALAVQVTQILVRTTQAQTVGPSPYVPGFFCWVQHERMGAATGATPDGRRAGWPLADGAGAAQGRERHGPTASALSTTKWSHQAALGGLVHNIKFAPSIFAAEDRRRAVRAIIETYLRRGGFEMQVNVVSADILREAQAHPEQHADLLVRVAGYSDYFGHLNRNLQDEVIARTEFSD